MARYTDKKYDEKYRNVLHAKWESIRRNKDFRKDYYDTKGSLLNKRGDIINKWEMHYPPNPKLSYKHVWYYDLIRIFNEGTIKHKGDVYQQMKKKSTTPIYIDIKVDINHPAERRITAEFNNLIRRLFNYREKRLLIPKPKHRRATRAIDLKIFKAYDNCEKYKREDGTVDFTRAARMMFGKEHLDNNIRKLQNWHKKVKGLIEDGYRHIK